MTNKDILEQYTAVLAECRILEKELSSLRDKGLEYVTDAVSGCPDYPPYGVRSVQIGGMAQKPSVKKRIDQLESQIEKQYKRALFWRNKAEDIISSVQTARGRLVLRYKYIEDLEWDEVADKLNDKSTMDSVRMYAKRILENL
ncbi:hypothetical protein [Faecalispora jeddahensis]|uniref:hypothetical protein n=1 Tax=Faecalispora jeddahensis TaxID=1414721 RepID=UPI001896B910|nr:hypothetical protein [Faecalispora jeddahensis]